RRHQVHVPTLDPHRSALDGDKVQVREDTRVDSRLDAILESWQRKDRALGGSRRRIGNDPAAFDAETVHTVFVGLRIAALGGLGWSVIEAGSAGLALLHHEGWL